ncbi:hypothetical protein XF30_20085 [Bradyrhizobium sp. SUTN9-2]|nr:hypothetical protein XF30_20085 [Bradyrhizobium sp. SUTN9-2]
MRTPPNISAPKLPRSPAEKAALQAFKEERESGSRLIRKGEIAPPKKRIRKRKFAKPKLTESAEAASVNEPHSQPPQKVTAIHQAQRRGSPRKVAVQFFSKRRPKTD